jgi:hypothetical protein
MRDDDRTNYRILSLDGGGTWALIQVKALIALYDNDPATPGRDVLRDFDLVAANSGGSIVLGGLLEDLPLGQIEGLFEDETTRKSIFSPSWIGNELLHDLTGVGPRYSAKNKLPALKKILPRTGMLPLKKVAAELRRPGSKEHLHLLITSFDYDRNRATFFRSSKTNLPSWGKGEPANVTLAEAIHASTNAPVNYFDAPAQIPGRPKRYWDGAIAGCNNPVLAAVTEAIGRKQQPMDIVALSIGTASVVLAPPQPGQPASPYVTPIISSWLLPDLGKLATAILDDPPDAATFLAHVMTGSGVELGPDPGSRIVRMSPLISPVKDAIGAWSAPVGMTEAQFDYLTHLNIDAIEPEQVDAISTYAGLWLRGSAPNQPIRMNGDTLKPELGQRTFSQAKAAWNAIR